MKYFLLLCSILSLCETALAVYDCYSVASIQIVADLKQAADKINLAGTNNQQFFEALSCAVKKNISFSELDAEHKKQFGFSILNYASDKVFYRYSEFNTNEGGDINFKEAIKSYSRGDLNAYNANVAVGFIAESDFNTSVNRAWLTYSVAMTLVSAGMSVYSFQNIMRTWSSNIKNWDLARKAQETAFRYWDDILPGKPGLAGAYKTYIDAATATVIAETAIVETEISFYQAMTYGLASTSTYGFISIYLAFEGESTVDESAEFKEAFTQAYKDYQLRLKADTEINQK